MMSFLKKQTAGIWATFLTLVLALISFIIYLVNINGEGYFQNAVVPSATLYSTVAMLMMVIVLVLAQLEFKGGLAKVVSIFSDALRIVVPAFIIISMMTLVSSRVEGFAFIYFSNEEVLQEVQTAANMASSHGAIANIVALVVTAIVGMIAAFFGLKKK